MTRVGASMVETISEMYFFTHVREEDAHLLSIYRDMSPLSSFIAPLLGNCCITNPNFCIDLISSASCSEEEETVGSYPAFDFQSEEAVPDAIQKSRCKNSNMQAVAGQGLDVLLR